MAQALLESTISDALGEPSYAASRPSIRSHGPLAILMGLYVAAVIPTLNTPYPSHHSFRTTQTADQARIFFREGINLFFPRISALGPRSHMAYEMPWYQALASIVMHLGVPETIALRITTVVCTLLTAIGVWALGKRLATHRAGVWAAGLFLFNPLIFVWGQASLIETFTTACVMGWVFAASKATSATKRNTVPWTLLAIALGCVAATSKFTTALPWAIAVFILSRPRRGWWCVHINVLLGMPLAAGYAWTKWADYLKSESVLTEFMMSDRTQNHTIRPLADRLHLEPWSAVGKNSVLFMGGMGVVWVAIAMWTLVRSRRAILAGAIFLTALAGPLVFFGLYQIHDYYQVAIVPAVSVLAGVGAAELNRRINGSAVKLGAILLAHITGFVVGGGMFFVTLPWTARPLTSELKTTTRPGEQVVGFDVYWSPQLLFEADRPGYMVTDVPPVATVVDLVDTELGSPRALYVSENGKQELAAEFLSHFRYVAAVGANTYRFGNQESDLLGGPTHPSVSWSSDVGELSLGLTTPIEISCDNIWHELLGAGVDARALEVSATSTVWFETQSNVAPIPLRTGTVTSAKPIQQVRCRPVEDGKEPLSAAEQPKSFTHISVWLAT
jgi:4-amino-4-deoxy-L-arabinose transferase-like glycosyltransferase